MSNLIDLTGKKFNMLTVISREPNGNNGAACWKCLCDCGNFKVVSGNNLRQNAVKSCGCLRKMPRIKHNLSHTKLYRVWASMKNRCYYQKGKSYKDYGARGIIVCDEWKNNFIAFYNWAISSGYKEGLTIERINNDGNYEPSNCMWITKAEQVNNRRNCVMITYKGKTQNLKQWCDELHLEYSLIHDRVRMKKWTFERAIITPCDVSKSNKKARGNLKNGRICKQPHTNGTA